MSELIGQEVAGFRIVREIARGGMGIVFEAEQLRLGRTVALKMLHPALTTEHDFLRRFEREARTLARLNHENIVGVIDFFHHDERYFLALEFVEGETLSRRLHRGARQGRFFGLAEASSIAWQVAQALAFAHDRQVIHRDLKPDNVMLTPRRRVKVMDFGIAQIVGARSDTEIGTRVGTPDYMAPEQLIGGTADERSDLFALGLIFYETITGRRPFSKADLLHAHRQDHVALPWDLDSLPLGSARVQPVLEKLLAIDPAGRYSSTADVLEDMREKLGSELLGDEAWTTPPRQAAVEPVGEIPPPPVVVPSKRHSRLRRLATVAALALLLVAAFAYHRVQQARFDMQQRKIDAANAHFQAFITDSQGRVTEAEHYFLRAVDLDPTVALYWRDLGDFYVKFSKPEKSLYYYHRTLELDPSDQETAKRLRQIESSMGASEFPEPLP